MFVKSGVEEELEKKKNKKLKNWNYVNSNQKRKRDNNTGKPFLPGEPGGP